MSKRWLRVVTLALAALLALPVAAQDLTPAVTVSDQLVTDWVVIDDVDSVGAGWIVIHIDNGGSPGPVAGYAAVADGHNPNVWVSIDTSMATPVLYAMLHTDSGEAGVYEFGTVEGADGPVRVNDQVVTPPFNVAVIDADPQFVADGTVTVKSVTTPADGWLVIHSDNNGGPGPVLGQTQISAGTTANVAVTLSGDATNTLWPMLHVDDGAIGTYEFGTVQGVDGPVRIGGRVAVTPFSTVPSISAWPQALIHGDNAPSMGDMSMVFHADSALSEGPGWLVIHSEADGGPGPVLGQTLLTPGANEDILIELSGDITPVVWPMLHVDSGAEGVYEFGTVEGADGPVRVDEAVVTFPVAIAPSINAGESEVGDMDGTAIVTVDAALIDVGGWLVIHSDNNGGPGPVLGQVWLDAGAHTNIAVPVDASGVGTQVWPMLHYDTGEAGVYEFGAVEGADGPVIVGGSVVVVPMPITGGEAAPAAEAPAAEEPMATEEA